MTDLQWDFSSPPHSLLPPDYCVMEEEEEEEDDNEEVYDEEKDHEDQNEDEGEAEGDHKEDESEVDDDASGTSGTIQVILSDPDAKQHENDLEVQLMQNDVFESLDQITSREQLTPLLVRQLKDLCKRFGLSQKGVRKALEDRLLKQ